MKKDLDKWPFKITFISGFDKTESIKNTSRNTINFVKKTYMTDNFGISKATPRALPFLSEAR